AASPVALPTNPPTYPLGVGRTYFVRTFGCQMNEHDSERIAGLLEADGLTAATSPEEADVVVLNTCCIRENADNKLYGTLGHLKSLKERRPHMQIAVGGCLAQKDQDLIQRKAPQVDVVFGTHNVGRAGELLRRAEIEGPVMEILDESEAFPSALPARRDLPYSAWIAIQIGCDNACAFCIVPSVRGKEISRPLTDIVAEVEAIAATGTVEVTLLGQNVNSYGRDLSLAARQAGASVRIRPQFAELLRAVGAVDGIRRVRFTSPHPKDLSEATIAAMAEVPTVVEHLHLPLQSGSDRVLAAMHRGYTAERYLERLAAARSAVPDLAVTADIIVGFPGETDDDFARTLEVVAEAAYDSAYTFIFSPRPGTEAGDHMTDELVAPDVIAERFDRLRVVVERSALRRHHDRIGRVEEVLVEGPSRRDPTMTSGRTRQNKLVHFAPVDGVVPAGSFADVRVTAAGPHHLVGELVVVTAGPRHRTLIPVASF
ncbi:MAG TPA: tRNA (N6-isopentenyl adenosine(37)-C2)-methylthiotransferase MiaB, partial [Acidimicrobiales bacterium]|nr:tRNA (N6-isopentenyl adenosine(37)-C2)-methylthiotransferase MiaB [Acidimicrobiales bacterium]